MKNSKTSMFLLPVAILASLGYFAISSDTSIQGAADGKTQSYPFASCRNDKAIRERLSSYFGDASSQFHLFEVSPQSLQKQLLSSAGAELPIVDAKGQVVVINQGSVKPISQTIRTALKGKEGQLVDQRDLSTQLMRFGCDGKHPYCGQISFLNAKASEFELLLFNKETGLSAIETVDSMFRMFTGKPEQIDDNCAISYNAASLGPISEFLDILPQEEHEFVGEELVAELDIPMNVRIAEMRRRGELFSKEIPIVLDADAQFYNQEKDSVWFRQRSIIDGVNLIYSVIEPISGRLLDIEFSITAQEAWTGENGPNTLNDIALLEEINADDYQMINHPRHDELSYFFVGYDLTGGIAGYAYRSCGRGADEMYGGNGDRQSLHAWGQQVPDVDRPERSYAFSTFLGRMLVASHEIGHMLGASHDDGSNNECAGGQLPTVCGGTIMKSGAAGGVAPDLRQPFFAQAADESIVSCVFRNDDF